MVFNLGVEVLLLTLWSCTTPCSSDWKHGASELVTIDGENWTQTALTDGICGSAFITSGNIDDDPYPEVIISNFNRPDGFALAPGFLTAYSLDSGLDYTQPITEEMEYKWPNDVVVNDIDGDGDSDLLVGLGFLTCQINPWTTPCGALTWFENTGGDWVPHDLVKPGSEVFYHKALLLDLNNDGVDDLVATGESYPTPFGGEYAATLFYWIGQGNGQFSDDAKVLADGFGSLLQLVDIDGDGDDDIASSEYFHPEPRSAVWLEMSGTSDNIEDNWQKHLIDDTSGPSIQFEVVSENDQIYGLLSNHTNTEMSNPDTIASGLYLLRPTDDPTLPWQREVIFDQFKSDSSSNQAAPGVFSVGDVDGDADLDILISGDGDPKVYLFEQEESGYTAHTLFDNMPQAGVHMVDTNNDGQLEMLVGSYDNNVVFLLKKEVQ